MAHNCEKYELWIDEYIDGSLSADRRRELESHLESCESCKNEYKLALALRAAVKNAEEELPEGLHGRIMSAVSAEPKKKQKPKRNAMRFWRGLSVAAACLFLCIGVFIGSALLPGGGRSEAPMPPSDKENDAFITNSSTECDKNESSGNSSFDDMPSNESSSVDNDEEGTVKLPECEAIPDSTTAANTDAKPSEPPTYSSGSIDGNFTANDETVALSSPGGNEITLALLIVSGLLAVASFIAFLISLSSVRSGRQGKEDK